MCFSLGDFFDSNRAHAGCRIHINQLFRRRILAGNQNITEQNRERLVTHQVLRHQHGMSQPQRLFLPRVTYLHHVADSPHHRGLLFLPFFFQEAFQSRRIVEVIFDGVFPFSGHDDDVLDPGNNALFHDILNLRLVHNRQHFFGLRFRRR